MDLYAATADKSGSNLALVVAIIGILGTLAATLLTQWLTTVREERRWERERDQEAKRWERERQERQEQWAREDAERWHRDQLSCYSRVDVDLDALRGMFHGGQLNTVEARSKLRTLETQIMNSLSMLKLLTRSRSVVDLCDQILLKLGEITQIQVGLDLMEALDNEITGMESASAWREIAFQIFDIQSALGQAVKEDLKISLQ